MVGGGIAPVQARAQSSHRDEASPLRLARVRGTVEHAAWIELGGARFAAVRVGSLTPSTDTTPPPQGELVPYTAGVCDLGYGLWTTTDPARVASLVGTGVDLLLPEDPRTPAPSPRKQPRMCLIGDGTALLPGAAPAELRELRELARKEGDALLTPLARLGEALGCPRRPGIVPTCETPVDLHVFGDVLAELKSPAALEYALSRGLDHYASNHFWWRRERSSHQVVWKYATGFDEPAPFWVIEMLWRIAPSQTEKLTRELHATNPKRALEIVQPLVLHPRAQDLFAELAKSGGDAGLRDALASLASWTNEHTRAFVEEGIARLRSAPPEPTGLDPTDRFAKPARVALAKLDARRDAGVTDGFTLARYLAANDWPTKTGVDFHAMHLTVIGKKGYPDLVADLGDGYVMKVDLELDTEESAKWETIPSGAPVTATGVLKSSFVGSGPPKYVALDLDFATVREGGDLPAAKPLPAPDPSAVKSSGKRGGCGCVAGDAPASTALPGLAALAALAIGGAILRRKRA